MSEGRPEKSTTFWEEFNGASRVRDKPEHWVNRSTGGKGRKGSRGKGKGLLSAKHTTSFPSTLSTPSPYFPSPLSPLPSPHFFPYTPLTPVQFPRFPPHLLVLILTHFFLVFLTSFPPPIPFLFPSFPLFLLLLCFFFLFSLNSHIHHCFLNPIFIFFKSHFSLFILSLFFSPFSLDSHFPLCILSPFSLFFRSHLTPVNLIPHSTKPQCGSSRSGSRCVYYPPVFHLVIRRFRVNKNRLTPTRTN